MMHHKLLDTLSAKFNQNLERLVTTVTGQSKQQKISLEDLIGISIEEHNIAMVHLHGNEIGNLVVKVHSSVQSGDAATQKKALLHFVEKHQLQGFPCCCVLASNTYTPGLIEAPKVQPSEVNEAVRWAIKDLIDYSTEHAVVAAFELPLVRASDNVKMSYAVVVHDHIINELTDLITAVGLQLRYIDIQELCLRNLAMLHPENRKGSLFLRMSKQGGHIVVTHKDELFISRKMELSLQKYLVTEEYLRQDAIADDEVLDNLALDVQRSMDYCSSMFRHCPANTIILSPSEIDVTAVATYLEKHLGMPTFKLDLNEHIWFEQQITAEVQKNCLMAIGAGLHNIQPEEL